ncbi:STAS/SEC14 domain-containing protein [Cyclobacterium sp.]|uniref:STAS/SEC14 domain-containing protein n=1 Tax=Cyclobacterium sp. TaxID=1966343 RepID=UPI0019C18358|nr:STAS/SEC14 domain-containing protein [Cyclobacterium sp.]MBD3627324.1 STAS/SEC14 domain-containing protein [Cyclobacterium sp.]
MLTILGPTEGKIIAVKIMENITHEDYSKLLPLLNHKITSNGEAFFYMEMEEFDLEAFQSFWEEMKFDTSHFCNFSRIALVGNGDWEIPRMDIVTKFGFREVRYYAPSEKLKALSWLSDQVEMEEPSKNRKVLGN